MWDHSDTWLWSEGHPFSVGMPGPAGGVAAGRGRGLRVEGHVRRGCHGDLHAWFSPRPKAFGFGWPFPSPAASRCVGACAAAPGTLGSPAQRGGDQRARHPGFRPLLPGAAEVSGGAVPGRPGEPGACGRGVLSPELGLRPPGPAFCCAPCRCLFTWPWNPGRISSSAQQVTRPEP